MATQSINPLPAGRYSYVVVEDSTKLKIPEFNDWLTLYKNQADLSVVSQKTSATRSTVVFDVLFPNAVRWTLATLPTIVSTSTSTATAPATSRKTRTAAASAASTASLTTSDYVLIAALLFLLKHKG